MQETKLGLGPRTILCVALALSASAVRAQVVTYQQGDGKGVVSDTDDNGLDSGVPGANQAVDPTCSIDQSTHQHCLLKYPGIIGNGANQIPLGSFIVSATLTLYITDPGTDCPTVHQLNEDWSETQSNWNERMTGVPWTAPGADGASHRATPNPLLPCTVGLQFENVDVTASVQNWANGELNAGWVFIEGPNNDGIDFATSEAVTPAQRPQLSVTYLPHVFYSIGTNTMDLKTGSPNITIAGGVATLTAPQTNDVGVGDVIDNGTELVYIWDVISDTQFRVQARDGTAASGVTNVPVVSIKRAFNSLSGAVTGSVDAFHLGTNDLVAAGRQLIWVLYDDTPFNVGATTTITGYVTDAAHYITLTVAGASQVATGNSQRHRGIEGTGARFEATAGPMSLVAVDEPFTRLEWLAFDGNDISTTEGIVLLNTADDTTIENVLIHHLTGTPGSETVTSSGIYIDPGNTASVVRNCMIYAYDGDGVHVSGTGAVVSNCTFYLGRTNPSSNSVQTDTGATATVYNSLALGAGNDFFENDPATLSLHHCISQDTSAQTYDVSGMYKTGVTVSTELVSAVDPIDLHLRRGAQSAEFGLDLSSSFTNDIDDDARPLQSAWDVGADESPFTSATVNYRSIGPAPPLTNQGTITVTAGSNIVTKTLGSGWLSQNRGRGDVLIVGADKYVIAAVESEDRLRITTLAVNNFVGGVYTIDRQFDDLDAWYSCVNNSVVCTHFPVSSPSLVTDDRSEVGIVYPEIAPLTGTANFQGADTDAVHTITLTVDPPHRHNGYAGTGVVIDANNAGNEMIIRDPNFTVEWLEFTGCKNGTSLSPIEVWGTDGPPVDVATNVLLQNLLIHNFNDASNGNSGIDITGNAVVNGRTVTIRNVMIWDGDQRGIEGDNSPNDVVTIENVTIDHMEQNGIWADQGNFIVNNTIVTDSGTDYSPGGGSLSGSNNISSDATAAMYFSNPTQASAASLFVADNLELHLLGTAAAAIDTGIVPTTSFAIDVDGELRPAGAAWDRGADEYNATTAVELLTFEAKALNGAVELEWETGSELHNLGFHLYRATTLEGRYERITKSVVPGLGSSPEGARYRYRDDVVENGITYFYKLADIETSGAATYHGPVEATPEASVVEDASRDTFKVEYGDPLANSFRVVQRGKGGVTLELTTAGFYATHQEDGTVVLEVPGFETLLNGDLPGVPVKRTWVEAIAGRKVALASVRERDVRAFDGLRPTDAGVAEIEASGDGTVRARRGHRHKTESDHTRLLYPSESAELLGVGFQGDVKKALVELAPLRWDETTGRLLLTRRLIVRLSFREREPSEVSTDGARGRRTTRRRSHERHRVVAHLATTERGLHRVRFEDVFGRGGRGVSSDALRLSRQGNSVAYFLSPNPGRFARGSVLYFVSEGASANPYGPEAVYQLEVGTPGTTMAELDGTPAGAIENVYRHHQSWELNLYYQSALVGAPELWLWDLLFAPVKKSYPIEVRALAHTGEVSTLSLWLQGASDFRADPDHHARVYVNGVFVGESRWDGKQPKRLDLSLPPGVLVEGDNLVELENVGDTGATYSLFFLDRFSLQYPRRARTDDGRLEGRWLTAGTAEVSGFRGAAHVLDTSGPEPRWLSAIERGSDGMLRFRAEPEHRYLAVDERAVHEPRIVRPRSSPLKDTGRRAEYLVIAPEALLPAAAPLLELRAAQGLAVAPIAIEEVYSEFGFGEPTPEAIKDFLSYAYQHWGPPAPRYVLLLGDATYDFKGALGSGTANQVPPRIVKTSFLWTASDPSYAAVNGEDILPDLAIGRLPAASLEEANAMVGKILAFEAGQRGLEDADIVLVADNADIAGNFEQDADVLADGVLHSHQPEKVYLSRLGLTNTRAEIRRKLDDGASLVSYIGHGGIHVWADENLFDTSATAALADQPQQPLLLTMNCLNGYFHFPYFDSLAESLVKAKGKGAIAAFSPSGLSLNGPAQLYHQALLEALLNGGHERLGDAVLEAQNTYAETGAFPELLSIYHLLGDPALVLALR